MSLNLRCNICKSMLKVHSIECTKKACNRKSEVVLEFPNPLAYLENGHVELILAFIANNGNLSRTAKVLDRNKTFINQELAIIRERLDSVIREVAILQDYGL